MINSNMNLSENLSKIKILLKDFKVGQHPKYFPNKVKKNQQTKPNNEQKLSVRKISSEKEKRENISQNIHVNNRKFSMQKP